MQAFHGQEEIKAKYISRVEEHLRLAHGCIRMATINMTLDALGRGEAP